jgi:hypothetical protein
LLHHFYISIDITITLRTTTISTEGEWRTTNDERRTLNDDEQTVRLPFSASSCLPWLTIAFYIFILLSTLGRQWRWRRQ